MQRKAGSSFSLHIALFSDLGVYFRRKLWSLTKVGLVISLILGSWVRLETKAHS
jgi:hypothetical protein